MRLSRNIARAGLRARDPVHVVKTADESVRYRASSALCWPAVMNATEAVLRPLRWGRCDAGKAGGDFLLGLTTRLQSGQLLVCPADLLPMSLGRHCSPQTNRQSTNDRREIWKRERIEAKGSDAAMTTQPRHETSSEFGLWHVTGQQKSLAIHSDG